MAYYSHTATFDKGWTTPLLGSRSDVDFWLSSLSYCVNFNVLTHGGLRRRSGTRFIAEVSDSNHYTRLLPFSFSEEQSYVLALNGNGSIRFLALRAQLYSGASPYSISHPYLSDDLKHLSYAQFNDVAYMAHKNHHPRKLMRSGDIDWAISQVVFSDGPYLDQDIEVATTLKPSGTGAASVASSNSSSSVSGGFQEYTLASAQVVDAYWVTATNNENIGDSPNGWTLSGWDGADWVVLDTVEKEQGWRRGLRNYFEITNGIAFTKYRFNWSGSQSSNASLLRWGAIGLHRKAENQVPFALIASSQIGINHDEGFKDSDVGRPIRLRGPNERWVWAKIVSYDSPTSVNIILHGHVLANTSPISSWQLGAFSQSSGYPGCVSLFNERVMWARTNTQPASAFGSKQGNFEDYGVSDPAVETDGLSITLLSSNQNEILWMADDEDLMTGSAGQIRSIGPADLNKSFSAINITQRKGPTSGASPLAPLSVGGVTLYAGSGGTKIRELVLGDQNRYVAPELSLIGEHLFKSGIKDWAFCERPDPSIYCAMGDGSLVSVTYDREQKVVGFSKHEIAKGFVESVAVIPGPSDGFDDVYMTVRRTINGQIKRYIEVLERPFDGDIDTVEDAFHIDCGLSYKGAAISIVSGLQHLEGETVVVLADGNVVSDLVVTGGTITLPYAASKISVGLRYISRAVTQPVAGPQQDGALFGRNRTIISAHIDVLNSGSAKVGAFGSKDWAPELFEQLLKHGDSLFGSAVELETGFIACDVSGSWMQGEGKLVIETDEPLPLLVRSLVLQLESTP